MLIKLLRTSGAQAMPPDVRRYLQLASLIFGTVACLPRTERGERRGVFALVLRCRGMMLSCLLPRHGAAIAYTVFSVFSIRYSVCVSGLQQINS